MKIKTNLYGIFHRSTNGSWCGPWQGFLFKERELDSWKEDARAALKKEIKVMRQVWEEN